MKRIILILLTAVSLSATAQKFSIKGQLVDTLSSPLPAATVMLLNPKDSSLVNFGVADTQGNFEIKNVSKGDHLFKVTFLGFAPYMQKVTTPDAVGPIDLGKIKMRPAMNELQAVEFAADKAPVTVKHDTIEFNAGSFKTKQNAVVEDLLKKLPGVEVDNDGNITAQGQQVRRVTVDGKNFFGSDPKVATKNLPADAIDKVQVFDKKSDQATFTGIDDGQREKTINLELKEEKRNGMFGTLMAGAGTDDRFQARGNLNRFTKGRQLSFLGMGNNVNEQGFSMDDYMNFTGGSTQMMGGGGAMRITIGSDNNSGVPLNFGNRANGIMTNYAGGLNFNNIFNPKTELNGSYFYNYLDHNRDQSTVRETFLPPDNTGARNSFLYTSNSKTNNTNNNHRVNLTLDHKLDSVNTLKLTANASYNETDSEVVSESQNYGVNGSLLNENQRLSLSYGSTANLNSNLLWRHKFAKNGRNLVTNFQLGLSETDRTGFIDALTTYYLNEPKDSITRQNSEQYTLNKSWGGSISYTEPLGGRKYLEVNYNFRQNLNDVERKVYDVNDDVQEFNPLLSNLYNSDYQYHRAGMNFKLNRSKFSITAGASVQQTYLNGHLEIQDTEINTDFQNFLPVFRFNYDFSNSKHLRFDYETSVQEPSIQQLQPVVDNSDPLNIYVGNPGLRPAYLQTWRMSFNTFNPANFLSFFAFADVGYTRNAITNARNFDPELGTTTTMPVNVDNNLSMAANATVSFPINKIGSRISIGGNLRNQRSVNVVNDLESTIDQQVGGGRFSYTYRYKEIFDISLSARLERQLTSYEFNQPNQMFLNNNYTADANLTFLKNFILSGSFEYLQYVNRNANFDQNIPLLNASISRYVLKNNAGEIKFSVNNIFDKALGINQSTNVNYIERQTTNSVGRYFMVSFIYSLNKQLNPMGMRRGGGNRMVIMR